MSQLSISDAEYAGNRKKTRREVFLEEMERAMASAAQSHRAVLPCGRSRPQAVSTGVDATRAPDAELVRAERPSHGGGTV
jgi:hypothetical protein